MKLEKQSFSPRGAADDLVMTISPTMECAELAMNIFPLVRSETTDMS